MRRVSGSQISRFMGLAQNGKTTSNLDSRRLKPQEPAQPISPLLEQARILDLVDETVMGRGTDGRITFWNSGAERMYGWTKEEATGRVSHTLLQTQFPQPLDSIEAELIRCGLWEGKLVHARRDGTQIEVNSRWALYNEGQGAVEMVLEINKRSG